MALESWVGEFQKKPLRWGHVKKNTFLILSFDSENVIFRDHLKEHKMSKSVWTFT